MSSTVRIRNDFGELRICSALGWAGIEPGGEVAVPAEAAYHWAAGGWTALDTYPVPHHLYANHAHDPQAYALPDPAAPPAAQPPPASVPAPTARAAAATPEESAK